MFIFNKSSHVFRYYVVFCVSFCTDYIGVDLFSCIPLVASALINSVLP